jgi:membrane-associated phospholipid phosphatase
MSATLLSVARFLNWIEARPGVTINDPILIHFTPIDLSIPIFILIYGGIVGAVFIFNKQPGSLLLFMEAYTLLIVFRAFAMYTLPLEPPIGTIPLVDPWVQFFSSSAKPLEKDLFFSGHTSTFFLLSLIVRPKWIQRLFLVGTLFIAVGVIWQRVHYVIDVIAAFPFAYSAYRLARYIHPDNHEHKTDISGQT